MRGNSLRENKPYTGFFSPTCARANTGKPRIILFFSYNSGLCLGCGLCVTVCPARATVMELRDP